MKAGRIALVLGILAGRIIVFGMMKGAWFKSEQASAESQRAADQALPAVDVSAFELASAYEANTIAADQRFKDKKIGLTSRVDSIATNLRGDPYLTLDGEVNRFMQPQLSFDKSWAPVLAKVYKGLN